MRNIYIIDAKQVVTSASHPEGALSNLPDFPITVDSRSYGATEQNPNGDSDVALIVAQAEFADEVKTLTVANNPTRVMWTVTLTQVNGVQIARKSYGVFPDLTPPASEPEPEEGGEENV